MIHTIGNVSRIAGFVDAYFQNFKPLILSFTGKSWSEEDLKGKSYQQWRAMQFYYLLYYLIIIRKEVDRLIDIKSWSFFVTEYNLVAINKCLACSGIDLDKALELFELGSVSEGAGVSLDEVEGNLQVYTPTASLSILTAKERLTSPVICVNNIEAGIDPGIPEGQDDDFDSIIDPLDLNDESDEETIVDN